MRPDLRLKIGCLERVGICNKVMGHEKGAYFLDYACVEVENDWSFYSLVSEVASKSSFFEYCEYPKKRRKSRKIAGRKKRFKNS